MTSWRIVVMGGVLAALAAATSASGRAEGPQGTQTSDAPATGVIAGRVVDAVNGGAVAKATLTLSAPGNASWPRGGRRAEADEAGRFEFSGLPAGRYSLTLRADDYVWGGYGALAAGDHLGNRIDLRSDEKLAGLTIPLWPAARLSGTVTDERGEPAVGLTVHFLRRQYLGARPLWMPSGQAKTDDRGRFASTNSLVPGEYLALLRAEPPSIRDSAVTHVSVFYGGGRTAASASLITLRSGDRREGIDFVTNFGPRATLLTVSGRITAPEEVRPTGYVGLVRREAEDPVADLEGFRAWLGTDGVFSFSHVPPGDYRLRFTAFPRATGAATWNLGRTIGKPARVSEMTTWFADVPLSLTRSVSDLDVPLQRAGRIRGRVVFDGRSSLPSAEILDTVLMHVDHADAREMSPSPSMGIPTGAVDAQGRFETSGLPPGRYAIEPTAMIDNIRHVVTSLRVEGREALETGLDVGTTDLTDVVVTLSGRTWNLSGVVRDQAGRPVPGGRVILFPRAEPDRQLGGYLRHPRLIHVAADRFGAFGATGAFAGEYLVAAVAALPEFWMAPEYLETLVPFVTPVRLELGEKQTVDVRIR